MMIVSSVLSIISIIHSFHCDGTSQIVERKDLYSKWDEKKTGDRNAAGHCAQLPYCAHTVYKSARSYT